MKLAGSFEAAVEVAEQNCREWIFLGSGEIFHADDLHEIAKEYDAKTPLEEEDFLAITDDGSIGLLFPYCKEPQWYFVSPEFAVVNVLKEDPRKYMIPIDEGEMAAAGADAAMRSAANDTSHIAMDASVTFCHNCGTQLKTGSRFCGECGVRNAPEFCSNCGTKLDPDNIFCANCGTKV